MKLVTVSEMQAVEREADESGLSYAKMMENAGRGLAEEILNAYSRLRIKHILALVGPGNNGGDALVALEHLIHAGWQASAYLVRRQPQNDSLVERVVENGGEIIERTNDPDFVKLHSLTRQCGVFLDGVLGTGVKLPLKEEIGVVLEKARIALSEMLNPPYIVAVDCPSGVDCDTGEAAPETIPAELTVTMAAVKAGLLRFPAAELTGEIKVTGIGALDHLASWQNIHRRVVDRHWVQSILPPRPRSSHKGTFGTVMVIAGSENYIGAAYLAGCAAYRVGSGLVTLAIPSGLHLALAGQFPEATWLLLPQESGAIAAKASHLVVKNLGKVTALLIGPGFGTAETTYQFLFDLLGASSSVSGGNIGFVQRSKGKAQKPKNGFPPVVVDADGLKLLARVPEWPSYLPENSVLTPHPGEMATLTKLAVEQIQSDRIFVAEYFATKWEHVVVLKGAFTVVASPSGETAVIPVATPSLARAGTGDVLAGLIAGLRAQGVSAYHAAVAGAWIHARAGIEAERVVGNPAAVLAGDVLAGVIEVLRSLPSSQSRSRVIPHPSIG